MKKGDKDDDDDEADAKASSRPLAEARGEEYKADAKASGSDVACGGSKAEALPAMRALGEDVPLEDLGEYWKGTDGLLRRATAHIYRKIIAPACEGGFREWFDDHCEIFDGSSKSSEHKPEFFVLYKGKLTTHTVQFDLAGSTCTVNKKSYGEFKSLGELVVVLSRKPLPKGWPCQLTHGIEAETERRVAVGDTVGAVDL